MEDFILSIVNLMGQVVESIRINGQVNSQYITLGTEVKGVYFVQSNKHNLNHKFINFNDKEKYKFERDGLPRNSGQ